MGGSCEKILPKRTYEGKTILKGQQGATLREQREEEDGCYGGHQQGKLT